MLHQKATPNKSLTLVYIFELSCRPLVYTVSALLPVAYLIGLIFTLKTHSHIYDIHVGEEQGTGPPHFVPHCWFTVSSLNAVMDSGVFVHAVMGHHGTVVHWSRWRSLVILIMATVLMSACADLATEHIQPILNQPNISQVGLCI